MTFLQSVFLFGLFAAVLPLLIHFFSRRKKERIPFSSLYFLKLLESKKIRRLKLKQILLLLLRMSILVLLVAAFARPTIIDDPSVQTDSNRNSTKPAPTNTPVSAVMILDNSLSTSADIDGTQMIELIRRKGVESLETLKDGDEIYLIFTGEIEEGLLTEKPAAQSGGGIPDRDYSRIDQFKPAFDKDVVRRRIQAARMEYKSSNLLNALKIGYFLLSSSSNLYREIFLISDMQDVSFLPPLGGTHIKPESNEAVPVRVYCINPALSQSAGIGNVSITGAEIQNQILEQGKQITLRATAQNFSDKPVRELLVNLYLDGQRLAQKSISLEAGAIESIDFQFIPEQTGILEGMIEIEDDALSEDNRRYFVVTIPEKVSVLIVNGDDEANAFLQSVYAPEFAAQFAVQTISEQHIPSIDFKFFDVVIYAGLTKMTQADVYRIRNFNAGGGGIIIFPGEQSDLSSLNETVGKSFALPQAVGFAGQLLSPGIPAIDYLTVDHVEWTHPVFSGMFKEEQPVIPLSGMPQVYRSVDFSPPSTGASRSIMTLSNNRPFLVETRVEQGAIMLFASAPSLLWTSFPLKGIFAPLMHRLVYYLSLSGGMDNRDLITGDAISFLYSGEAENLSIIPPIGESYRVNPVVASEAFRVDFAETNAPGIYSFTSGDEVHAKFAVNIDTRESDLHPISMERLNTIFGDRPFFVWDTSDNIIERIREARSGKEISRYFIIAVLLFLLVETILQYEHGEPEKDYVRK